MFGLLVEKRASALRVVGETNVPERNQFSPEVCRVIVRMSQEVVCEAHGVSHTDIKDDERRDYRIAHARQTAMYLAHVVGQLTLNEVALNFNRKRSTVSHGCIVIEDRRDSPVFDLQMEYMETRLRERISRFRQEGPIEEETPPELKTIVGNY